MDGEHAGPEFPFLWLMVWIFIAVRGGGPYSLDAKMKMLLNDPKSAPQTLPPTMLTATGHQDLVAIIGLDIRGEMIMGIEVVVTAQPISDRASQAFPDGKLHASTMVSLPSRA